MIGIAFCCINERSHGVFIGIFLFQNRKRFNFSPAAVRHLSQQVLHGIRIGAGKLRIFIPEGIGRTADKLIDAVLLPDIIKPQGVCFSYVILVDNSGAVALNSDVFIGALINIVAEIIGIACRGVSMSIPAKRCGCRQTVRARNNIAALCVFLDAADIAVFVIICILQPIHRRICGVNRAPKSFICAVFMGHGIGQSIFDIVAGAARHIVPAVKHIAVPCRGIYNKGRSVAGINRLCAVAAVHIEFDHVIIAVVVALKNGGAVGSDCLGVMIQLGKALCRLLILHRKLLVGNNRAGFGRGYAVKPHILAIHIVVDILEVVPHGIGHINCLIIDIYDILSRCIVCRNIQSNYRRVVIRVHRAALRNGNRRICRIIKRRISEIGR